MMLLFLLLLLYEAAAGWHHHGVAAVPTRTLYGIAVVVVAYVRVNMAFTD